MTKELEADGIPIRLYNESFRTKNKNMSQFSLKEHFYNKSDEGAWKMVPKRAWKMVPKRLETKTSAQKCKNRYINSI